REEAYRGRRLEEGRLGRADVWPESLCGREQRRLLDGCAIDADPLAERGQVRRGVETGAVTGGVQDTGDRRGDTALPIRAADVDRRVCGVRIADRGQQCARPLERPADASREPREQLTDQLLVVQRAQALARSSGRPFCSGAGCPSM